MSFINHKHVRKREYQCVHNILGEIHDVLSICIRRFYCHKFIYILNTVSMLLHLCGSLILVKYNILRCNAHVYTWIKVYLYWLQLQCKYVYIKTLLYKSLSSSGTQVTGDGDQSDDSDLMPTKRSARRVLTSPRRILPLQDLNGDVWRTPYPFRAPQSGTTRCSDERVQTISVNSFINGILYFVISLLCLLSILS